MTTALKSAARLGTFALVATAAACGPSISGGPEAESSVSFADEAIAFDDINYAPSTNRILAPARSHGLKLVDPDTLDVTTISGGDADSASSGAGFLFVLDRGAGEVRVIDETSLDVVHTAALGGDYVRYVESENEVWVTQPFEGRIQVLALEEDGALTFKAPVTTAGGPEGLTVDETRGVTISHVFGGDAFLVDAPSHATSRNVSTGCFGAHGIPALDVTRGLAFLGCRDAEIVSVSLDDGAQRGRYRLGSGESVMAFDPASSRAFLRGDPGNTIAILEVGDDGSLTEVGSRTATERGHCLLVAAGSLWACDETGGGLLRYDLSE